MYYEHALSDTRIVDGFGVDFIAGKPSRWSNHEYPRSGYGRTGL